MGVVTNLFIGFTFSCVFSLFGFFVIYFVPPLCFSFLGNVTLCLFIYLFINTSKCLNFSNVI